MSKFKFTLEEWIPGNSRDGYIVRVTPKFTGDEEDPLALSIEKWRFIVEILREQPGTDVMGGGTGTCALCAKHRDLGCMGCPVTKTTGHPGCAGSPYQREWCISGDLAAAQAELEFLQSLKEDERERA